MVVFFLHEFSACPFIFEYQMLLQWQIQRIICWGGCKEFLDKYILMHSFAHINELFLFLQIDKGRGRLGYFYGALLISFLISPWYTATGLVSGIMRCDLLLDITMVPQISLKEQKFSTLCSFLQNRDTCCSLGIWLLFLVWGQNMLCCEIYIQKAWIDVLLDNSTCFYFAVGEILCL